MSVIVLVIARHHFASLPRQLKRKYYYVDAYSMRHKSEGKVIKNHEREIQILQLFSLVRRESSMSLKSIT